MAVWTIDMSVAPTKRQCFPSRSKAFRRGTPSSARRSHHCRQPAGRISDFGPIHGPDDAPRRPEDYRNYYITSNHSPLCRKLLPPIVRLGRDLTPTRGRIALLLQVESAEAVER